MPISIRHVLPEETVAVYRLSPEFAGLHDAQTIRQRTDATAWRSDCWKRRNAGRRKMATSGFT
ncbi:hypothetical protein ACSMAF_001746 [Cronobacter universalis]